MFGAIHFIYYINRSIVTKVDQQHTAYMFVTSDGPESVAFRSLVRLFPLHHTCRLKPHSLIATQNIALPLYC